MSQKQCSEGDSDRRAARASRAWPLPGSGARARASGSGGRAQPAARRIMSHGRVTIFGALACSQPARIQHRIHASVGKFHACSHAWTPRCMLGRLPKLFHWPCDMIPAAEAIRRTVTYLTAAQHTGSYGLESKPTKHRSSNKARSVRHDVFARTRARASQGQGPGPAGARGAAVRIDF